MATNSASGNPSQSSPSSCPGSPILTEAFQVGQPTGPATGKPPSASEETKAAILDAAGADPVGQHRPGQDGGSDAMGAKKAKSEKERESIDGAGFGVVYGAEPARCSRERTKKSGEGQKVLGETSQQFELGQWKCNIEGQGEKGKARCCKSGSCG